MQFNERGEKDFEALARFGHQEGRVVQTSFSDLLPRDLTDETVGELLQKPTEDEIERQTRETQAAFNKILSKSSTAGKIQGNTTGSIVKFTPSGSDEQKIVKIYEMPKDPFDPPKFSHKRAPKPPPSPPAPVLHSPPRKVSAQEQKNWAIPPCVSNWKNSKGYTIALDKRLAADGRGLRENLINEGFASFAESLYLAESHARDEVEKRAIIEKKLVEKEKGEQEEMLRSLAQKARDEKAAVAAEIKRSHREEEDTGRYRDDSTTAEEEEEEEESKFGPMRVHGAQKNLSVREREELRREMAKQQEKDFRLSRMSQEQKVKYLERSGDRDISEKIALGQVDFSSTKKVDTTTESIFDQRLFDQSAGIGQGLADDESYNIYDKALFGGSAVHLIYKPTLIGDDALNDDDDTEDVKGSGGPDVYGRVKKASKAFQGAEGGEGERSGPVEFEKDESTETDPFGLDSFISEAKKRSSHHHDTAPPNKKR